MTVGYVLNVEGPIYDQDGRPIYKDNDTGELRTGWFHCGCCGLDGFMSVQNTVCTDCSNKLIHGSEHSKKSVDEIRKYCRQHPIIVNGVKYVYYCSSSNYEKV